MNDIIEIVFLFLGFYLIMLFHEGGHFLISKIVKFSCEEFQIGIGPKLIVKENNGTKYSIKLIPFGGMCTFKEFIQEHTPSENIRGFYLRKIAVILGGPIMNFFLAFTLMVCSLGNLEGLKINTVNDVQLENTTITQGDIIRNINNERVFNIDDVEELLVPNTENTITFLNSEYEKETVSFYCDNTVLDLEFDNSFKNKFEGSVRTFGKYITLITESVKELFSDESSVVSETIETKNPYNYMDNLEVPQSFSRILNKFLMITSILSFCLGAFNLLPIVAFDGFKALVALISVLINREISKKFAIVIAVVGVIISLLILF